MYIVAVNVFIIEKITSLIDNQLKELKEKLKEIFFQEYDDVDFQSNSIMKSLIPNGFCFQYISYNKCNKPMCKYRHDVPSKVWHVLLSLWSLIKGVKFRGTFISCYFFDMYLQEEIFKKGIHEISRLYNQSDKKT